MTTWRLIIGVLLAACLGVGAFAQNVTTADTGHLAGADRMARLVAGAKMEGSVTIYSSAPVDIQTAITGAFEKKYGVKVNLWRGGSEDILQRVTAESRAGLHDVDVIETAGPDMEAVNREKLLQEVSLPAFADLMPQSVVPGRPWITSRLSVFVTAYNTNLVSKAQAPKRYEDLLDPRWKGKLGIETDDANWLMAMAQAMGEDKALKLFRDIVAKNGMSVRKGHALLANLVVSGEVPLTPTAYIEQVRELKKSGAPIDYAFLDPVIAMPTAGAVFKQAPHPYAAVLFLDFYLTEGEKILADNAYVPTNLKVQKLPPGLKLSFMDVGKFLDEEAKWTKLHKEIFSGR